MMVNKVEVVLAAVVVAGGQPGPAGCLRVGPGQPGDFGRHHHHLGAVFEGVGVERGYGLVDFGG